MRPAGQASILILGGLAGILVGALVLGAVARAIGREGEAQRAADLGALAGARAMYASYPRLFEPPSSPSHLDRAAYLALGRAAAQRVALANGANDAAVAFPDGTSFAPVRVRVAVGEDVAVSRGIRHARASRRRGGARAARRPRVHRRRLRRPARVPPGQADEA